MRDLGEDAVPLTQAALPIGVSRETMLRSLLRGLVVGGQMRGKWFCERASLRAFVQRNTQTGSASNP